jgi:endo-1,4-beta-xylanase
VNEAIDYVGKGVGGLKETAWFRLLGPDFIPLAFEETKKADPKAMLVWNENSLEPNLPPNNRKRDVFYEWLVKTKRQGVPLDAVGIQAHLTEAPFAATELRQFVRAVGSLGLKVLITELDVTDQAFPSDVEKREQIVAEKYSQLLSALLPEKNVIAVITWGLSSKYSWLKSYKPRTDGLTPQPLPFDENYKPTPAWKALSSAFEAAPAR